MGIFDALNTAVAGLQSQSYALQNISGNIANASTIGYKGINTSFEDLVAQASSPTAQVAGGVTALSQQTLTTSGTVSSSTVATNMAINGDGFFSVQKPTSVVDNEPVFNGVTDYTRAGDFQVNANGNLVNGAGYYLMGVTVDPKTGNPLGNVPQVLQFQNNFVPAQPTTNIQYAANLPTVPQTTASTTATPGTLVADGGLDPSAFSANPLVLGTPATPFGDNTVTGAAALNTSSLPDGRPVRSPRTPRCPAPPSVPRPVTWSPTRPPGRGRVRARRCCPERRRPTRCRRALRPVTPSPSTARSSRLSVRRGRQQPGECHRQHHDPARQDRRNLGHDKSIDHQRDHRQDHVER